MRSCGFRRFKNRFIAFLRFRAIGYGACPVVGAGEGDAEEARLGGCADVDGGHVGIAVFAHARGVDGTRGGCVDVRHLDTANALQVVDEMLEHEFSVEGEHGQVFADGVFHGARGLGDESAVEVEDGGVYVDSEVELQTVACLAEDVGGNARILDVRNVTLEGGEHRGLEGSERPAAVGCGHLDGETASAVFGHGTLANGHEGVGGCHGGVGGGVGVEGFPVAEGESHGLIPRAGVGSEGCDGCLNLR